VHLLVKRNFTLSSCNLQR